MTPAQGKTPYRRPHLSPRAQSHASEPAHICLYKSIPDVIYRRVLRYPITQHPTRRDQWFRFDAKAERSQIEILTRSSVAIIGMTWRIIETWRYCRIVTVIYGEENTRARLAPSRGEEGSRGGVFWRCSSAGMVANLGFTLDYE
ncbi:hypothetical protein KM043_008437 [Ampulex compressa]|nr:hypothetical protein KM043_008437 [Ampulex compressa]